MSPLHLHLPSSLLRWAERAIRQVRRGERTHADPRPSQRRMLLVHLDGVPKDVLVGAMAAGKMPFLDTLLRSGAYQLDSAFWGFPASTPAFEAGALYGVRTPDIPAYRWFDRQRRRNVAMNVPSDARAVEERLSGFGEGGLLANGGTAYLTLFRGDASNLLCMSALAPLRAFTAALRTQVRHALRAARRGTLGYLWHLARELLHGGLDGAGWGLKQRDFRHEREFLLNRLLVLSLGWGLAHNSAVADMVRGVPSIYLVWGNFDEVSHRRGPSSPQAARELHRVDAALAGLYAVARSVDVPYDLFLVTDHGQADVEPFERRAGKTLLQALTFGAPALSEDVTAGLLEGRRRVPFEAAEGPPVVVDSGNAAHVYLPGADRPLEAAEVLRRHAQVLARATSQPGVGLVAVRRQGSAAAIVGGQVVGPNELSSCRLPDGYSPHAVKDMLLALPRTPSAGDLVLFGDTTPDGRTVGFSWEFGSHGGLTVRETEGVALWPTDGPAQLDALGHSAELHQRLCAQYRA